MKGNNIVKIGKWTFDFCFFPVYWGTHNYMFSFGVFKILDFPPEGSDIMKSNNYKGFWFRKQFNIGGFGISI